MSEHSADSELLVETLISEEEEGLLHPDWDYAQYATIRLTQKKKTTIIYHHTMSVFIMRIKKKRWKLTVEKSLKRILLDGYAVFFSKSGIPLPSTHSKSSIKLS